MFPAWTSTSLLTTTGSQNGLDLDITGPFHSAMTNPNFLITGLGNITFPATRHSLGHQLVDALASRLGIHLSSGRIGWTGSTNVEVGQRSVTLTLFKPRALMNITGKPVVQMLRQTAVNSANLIVIHDSLDHKPCVLSPKFGGSANGHNGVRSIIAALGNNGDFHRLRLGIGRGPGGEIASYVLKPLSKEERRFWSVTGAGSDVVWESLTSIIQKNSEAR